MSCPPDAYPFCQVDVFTERPLLGNPVAVVLDSAELTTETMRSFTSWTNLSEAAFITAPSHPEADYAVRIFDPTRELPFAGHPTLGACHAWLEAGGEPRGEHIIQECGAGLVQIRRSPGGGLAFCAPPLIKGGPLNPGELAELLALLKLSPEWVLGHQWCDNGPGWRALLLDSCERLYSIDARALACELDIGLIAPSPRPEVDFEVRALFPGSAGMTEDPATGSLNAALGQWLITAGHAPVRYTALQGLALNRWGLIHVERAPDGSTWVGGRATSVLKGVAHLS